jgi:HEAT repeat protein
VGCQVPRAVVAALVALCFALKAWGHGSQLTPPPEESPPPPPPPPPRPPPPPPEPGTPPPPPSPSSPRPAPTEPTGPEAPPERGPRTAPESSGSTEDPATRRASARRRAGADDETSWRIWWEFNREHLLGLRARLRRSGTITGERSEDGYDPLGERRQETLEALRRIALHGGEPTLRAAALIAIGRMGGDDDARLCLKVLAEKRAPSDTLEGAALALGLLPAVEDPVTAGAVRAWFEYVFEHPGALPHRARGFAVVAAGLRSRGDKTLLTRLVAACAAPNLRSGEAATLLLACGLARDPMLQPELLRAARRGMLGRDALADGPRAHAAHALAFAGDAAAAEALVELLRSRRSGVHTRRSAALALGKVLRESPPDDARGATAALLASFRDSPDPLLRGFCALALGGARRPAAVPELMEAIDHGGSAALKPYAALALGLAARSLSDGEARRVRSFLAEELGKSNELERSAALTLALGLSGAREAARALLDRLADAREPAGTRGAAAQALGLLGDASPPIVAALERALKDDAPEVVQDAALAMGLLGRRDVAAALAASLRRTDSTAVQGRIILALGYLGNAAAVDPLLDTLRNEAEKDVVREFAATALGILGDRRERDLLFEIDAWFNYYATSIATHELIRLY